MSFSEVLDLRFDIYLKSKEFFISVPSLKKLVELSDTIPTSPNVTRLAWKSESVSSKYLSLADNYKQWRNFIELFHQ